MRALDDAGRIGRAEQRAEDAIGDHRARRGQVAVHADVARERAQVRAGVRELDAERDVGGREPVGGARAHRDEAVGEPRGDLRDAEPGEVSARLRDALVERRGRDAHRERPQPRAPPLVTLCLTGARIGAELGDLELEPLDDHRPGDDVAELEPRRPTERVERERQAARGPRAVNHVAKRYQNLCLGGSGRGRFLRDGESAGRDVELSR